MLHDTWLEKIPPGQAELVSNEASVEPTPVDPDEVRFDRDHPDREVFYRRGALPPPDHRDFLKVVVAFRTSAEGRRLGRVVTAYATDGVKAGERLKWKR